MTFLGFSCCETLSAVNAAFSFFLLLLQITALTDRLEESNHQCCSFPGDEKPRFLSLLPDGGFLGDGEMKCGHCYRVITRIESFFSCLRVISAFMSLGRQASYSGFFASAHFNRIGPSRTTV